MSTELTPLKKWKEIENTILANQNAIKQIMPDDMGFKRFLKGALLTIKTNDKLIKCTPRSIVLSLLHIAYMGWEVGGFLGQAFIVPYKDHGISKAQAIPGYRGFIDIAYRSKEVKYIDAFIVYGNEPFEYELGINPKFIHKPLPPSERGENIIGSYMIVDLANGMKKIHWEWYDRIEELKGYSKAAKLSGSIWEKHPEIMIKKTVIRQSIKFLPVAVFPPKFNQAAILDSRADVGAEKKLLLDHVGINDILGPEGKPLLNEEDQPQNENKTPNFDSKTFSKGSISTPDTPEETPPNQEGEEVKASGECKQHGVYYTDSCEKCKDQPAKEKPEKKKTGKTTKAAEKKKDKAPPKESPSTTRGRVADFIKKNKQLHDELNKLFGNILADGATISAYLEYDNVSNSDIIPDGDIKLMDDILKDRKFYEEK